MKSLALSARIIPESGGYRALIESLSLEAFGETPEEAQDNLVRTFYAWLEHCEEEENLAHVLADAGFPGITDDTELELQFL